MADRNEFRLLTLAVLILTTVGLIQIVAVRPADARSVAPSVPSYWEDFEGDGPYFGSDYGYANNGGVAPGVGRFDSAGLINNKFAWEGISADQGGQLEAKIYDE